MADIYCSIESCKFNTKAPLSKVPFCKRTAIKLTAYPKEIISLSGSMRCMSYEQESLFDKTPKYYGLYDTKEII